MTVAIVLLKPVMLFSPAIWGGGESKALRDCWGEDSDLHLEWALSDSLLLAPILLDNQQTLL